MFPASEDRGKIFKGPLGPRPTQSLARLDKLMIIFTNPARRISPALMRPYRSRTVKPCDACRRRRIGCVRAEGAAACSLCSHRGTICTFTTRPKPRERDKTAQKRSQDLLLPTTHKSATSTFNNNVSASSSPPRRSPTPDESLGGRPPGQDDADAAPPTSTAHVDNGSNFWGSSEVQPSSCSSLVFASSLTRPDRPRPELSIAAFTDSTLLPDRTCLYSGSSSDQDPNLLRHLVYDSSSRFGDDRWMVWRVGGDNAARTSTATRSSDGGTAAATYLTIFPNEHLDVHTSMYSTAWLDDMVSPAHQEELIRLYYAHVHPSYPILDPIDAFLAKRSQGRLPASLLALVYLHAYRFWNDDDDDDDDNDNDDNNTAPAAAAAAAAAKSRPSFDYPTLYPHIFTCLAHESRTPNVAVVQAALLFQQLPPNWVRAPNHPGAWATACLAVGLAQDIGLNLDAARWAPGVVCGAEKKLRRVLWWAVYAHDKWVAHWLGRPSHVGADTWDVAPLTLADFSDGEGRLPVEAFIWANALIALAALAVILSDVLNALYSVRPRVQRDDTGGDGDGDDKRARGGGAAMMTLRTVDETSRLLARLEAWKREHHHVLAALPPHNTGSRGHPFDPGRLQPCAATVQIAALALQTSIYRAVFAASQRHAGAAAVPDVADRLLQYQGLLETLVKDELLPLFEALSAQEPKATRGPGRRGGMALWLSYNKGNVTTIGSCLITLVLSSVSGEQLNERRALLLAVRKQLVKLVAAGVEFARLPLRRLSLIIEELLGCNDVDTEENNDGNGSLYHTLFNDDDDGEER